MAYIRTAAYGGNAGTEFQDNLTEVARIAEIEIKHGDLIDSITLVWELTDAKHTRLTSKVHGGKSGKSDRIVLKANEYIVRVEGTTRKYVDSLTFHTNIGGKFGPYGGDGRKSDQNIEKKSFEIKDVNIRGCFGRAGDYLDKIGFFSFPR